MLDERRYGAGEKVCDGMQANILFVEDNADLRENAALVLGLEGYRVKVARDGREALDILEAGFIPQIIVSDIMMPRMDGYEFFDAVRQKNHLKAVPFIFLTARGSRHDVSLARSLGVDDYLVKPFDPEEFLIAVQNKLRRTAEIRDQAVEGMEDTRRVLVDLLSHELRTPLTFVTGGFALLAEELEHQQSQTVSEDIRASLELIQNGTQRLNRLAEQTVLYSQIISGYITNYVRETSEYLELSLLVTDAMALMFNLSQERNITLQPILPEEELVTIYGVRTLLVTALSELVRNAIQYSPVGSLVRLAVSSNDERGMITVIDRGVGIKLEDQANIWNVLTQSERSRNEQQGIGMGLPIVKGIVTAHEGTITLSSAPGQGTEVVMSFPLALLPDY
jgi:two-component system, sensor histidine kinase and response regulator